MKWKFPHAGMNKARIVEKSQKTSLTGNLSKDTWNEYL